MLLPRNQEGHISNYVLPFPLTYELQKYAIIPNHCSDMNNDPVFLVIDEYITYDQTQELLNKLAIKFVIIEGHRFRQRKQLAGFY